MSINKDFEFNMMIISGCQDCVIMTAEGCLATQMWGALGGGGDGPTNCLPPQVLFLK